MVEVAARSIVANRRAEVRALDGIDLTPDYSAADEASDASAWAWPGRRMNPKGSRGRA